MNFPHPITTPPQNGWQLRVNEAFKSLAGVGVFARDDLNSTGLALGYFGGPFDGATVAAGVVTPNLTDNATNYVVVHRATRAVSSATTTNNWNNTATYGRMGRGVAAAGVVTWHDERFGPGGILAGGRRRYVWQFACSDYKTTALAAATDVGGLFAPFAATVLAVWASLHTAQASGVLLTVDINEAGTSILSTKLSIDNTENTSHTAATPAVISDAAIAAGAKLSADVDQVGDGTAKGLQVYMLVEEV